MLTNQQCESANYHSKWKFSEQENLIIKEEKNKNENILLLSDLWYLE